MRPPSTLGLDFARPRPVVWMGSSRRFIREMPAPVQDAFGRALYLAQIGRKALSAKPLRGFAGASVLEIVEDHDGDTYRAVYTVRFERAVYVLHVFQKKSRRGIATSQQDIALIRQRLSEAEEDYGRRYAEDEG